LKKRISGYEKAYLLQTASQSGIRETRRIVGEYIITKEDILGARKCKDKIARVKTRSSIKELIWAKM